ncbi:iron ABC transporter permease [Rhizobium sp. TRM95111]|uniref:ABC transporter permease n=1 Tax=Rhizobium alarense TaxID=2846851 RepID=UPI001F173DD0|nr:iron ABC transporter permease [Rhizobium alarense]MCF3640532.1 iron ABC transporter permease [Rhizobium alarense]
MPRLPQANSQPRWLFPSVLVVVFLLSALPLGRLLLAGLKASLEAGGLPPVLAERGTWNAVRNTLSTALLGMVVSMLIGATFAFATSLTDIGRKRLLSFLFMLPMMIPPQITALAWVEMSGPASPLLKTLRLAPPLGSPQPLYSIGGIALLFGVQHAPLVFLALRAGLASVPRDLVEASRLSGATPFRTFLDIVLPLAMPGVIAGAAIAFVSGVGNFGIPAILGIPASIFTLPTLVYSRLASFGAQTFADLAVLSMLIGLISVAGIVVQQRAMRGRDYRMSGLSGGQAPFPLGRIRFVVEGLLWLVLLAILVAPLLALVASSLVPAYGVALTPDTVSFGAYADILFRQAVTRSALANSLVLAAVSAGLLLVFASAAAYLMTRQGAWATVVIATLIEIPYALPGIVLAVCFILLLAAPLPILGISLYGTLGIILIAYLSSFFALSLKPMESAFRQLDPALEEAARLSGAGFWRRLREVLLPAVAPAAGAAFVLVFLTACNELTVSALLWSAGTQTLGVAIFNLDDSGSSDLAAALSVLVVLMVVFLMAMLEALSRYMPRGALPWRS